jgi:D-alanyl-D-alanine endopeptidase (penicillin-binding protein 7)
LKNLRTPLILCAIAFSFASFSTASFARAEAGATKKNVARFASLRKKSSPVRARYVAPKRPSFGQIAGLHELSDELSLKSSVAYVIDQDTQEVLLSKNDNAVLPIASINK